MLEETKEVENSEVSGSVNARAHDFSAHGWILSGPLALLGSNWESAVYTTDVFIVILLIWSVGVGSSSIAGRIKLLLVNVELKNWFKRSAL